MRILIAEANEFSSKALEILKPLGCVEALDSDRAGLLSRIGQADVLWVRLRHRIDAEVLAAAPRLWIIVTPTTGLKHIDLDETQRRGIRVLSLRGETEFLKEVRATAELTLGLALALLRRIPQAAAHVRSGGWSRDLFKGLELYGRTAGVVGYGRLGRIVARYFRALDMRVLTTDPQCAPADLSDGVELVSLNPLLEHADLVSLHVNLTPENEGFFGRREFGRMRRGSFFINTSRGELVEEEALLRALESGHLAGAALDVLAEESAGGMAGHPLLTYARTHANLIITPHIGGCTQESMEKTELFLAQKLVQTFSNATGCARRTGIRSVCPVPADEP